MAKRQEPRRRRLGTRHVEREVSTEEEDVIETTDEECIGYGDEDSFWEDEARTTEDALQIGLVHSLVRLLEGSVTQQLEAQQMNLATNTACMRALLDLAGDFPRPRGETSRS